MQYWGNAYSYDAWGNLLQKIVTKCGAENILLTADNHNQLTTAGYAYDAAGNMTADGTEGLTLNYDQENRITGAGGYTYTYDADGNRVEKSNGTTGTLYWYMTPGIVAESDLTGALKSEYVFFNGERVARRDLPSGSVAYYFSDHLKTASVITDASGNIKSESDYYPWGGELQFVANDSNHYKFTGKERDETGLDYFGARYYSNGLGRFMTPDWAAKAAAVPYADFADPQSLNLYTYARNLPTTKADIDGHTPEWWQRLVNAVEGNGFNTDAEVEKQKLVSAQDDARADKDFQPGANGQPSHCNQATCYIAQRVNAPMRPLQNKNGKPADANQQARQLAAEAKKPNGKYREVSAGEAQKLSDSGKLVLAAWRNPTPKHSGHSSTVRPQGVPGDQVRPNSRGPLINNIGTSVQIAGKNYAYGNDKDVHYYTPR